MKMIIPKLLKFEHKKLHGELVETIKISGPIGKAAQAVAKVLHPHFVKEEEYALPPIGLLQVLAKGNVSKDMKDVLVMTDKLKKDLPNMLKEHKAIVVKLKKLVSTAKKEKRPEFAHFAEKLMIHAQTEEEVLYPAAILIGEFIKLKLKE
ncbi:MAG: hemerythrin domain-containing protein [Thermodesulfovibrionales bacterium]|nr:hemerythrin domain-containing protein [Thermodesulfovibrionales bacterium]